MTMTMTILSWLVTAAAIVGVLLNNAKRRACFLVWMGSNAASAIIHAAAWTHGADGMAAMVARDMVFLALAVAGWVQWRRKA